MHACTYRTHIEHPPHTHIHTHTLTLILPTHSHPLQAVLIDMEESVVGELVKGPLGEVFNH